MSYREGVGTLSTRPMISLVKWERQQLEDNWLCSVGPVIPPYYNEEKWHWRVDYYIATYECFWHLLRIVSNKYQGLVNLYILKVIPRWLWTPPKKRINQRKDRAWSFNYIGDGSKHLGLASVAGPWSCHGLRHTLPCKVKKWSHKSHSKSLKLYHCNWCHLFERH